MIASGSDTIVCFTAEQARQQADLNAKNQLKIEQLNEEMDICTEHTNLCDSLATVKDSLYIEAKTQAVHSENKARIEAEKSEVLQEQVGLWKTGYRRQKFWKNVAFGLSGILTGILILDK